MNNCKRENSKEMMNKMLEVSDLTIRDIISLLLEYDMDSKILVQHNSMQYFLRKNDIKKDDELTDRVIIEV